MIVAGIRVDEDDAVAFLTQRAARLNAGVVELGGLTDDDRPGAYHHDVPARHAGVTGLAATVRSAFRTYVDLRLQAL